MTIIDDITDDNTSLSLKMTPVSFQHKLTAISQTWHLSCHKENLSWYGIAMPYVTSLTLKHMSECLCQFHKTLLYADYNDIPSYGTFCLDLIPRPELRRLSVEFIKYQIKVFLSLNKQHFINSKIKEKYFPLQNTLQVVKQHEVRRLV